MYETYRMVTVFLFTTFLISSSLIVVQYNIDINQNSDLERYINVMHIEVMINVTPDDWRGDV